MPADDLLKVSKFNYSCVDQDGNLLLCNFSRGQNSFSKVLKNNVDKYNIVMGSENIILDENCTNSGTSCTNSGSSCTNSGSGSCSGTDR